MRKNAEKSGPGRPAIGSGRLYRPTFRPEDDDALMAWIARQPEPRPKPTEAIRTLTMRAIEAGL